LTELPTRPVAPAPASSRPRGRLSFEHLVMIVAGLLALVLMAAALRDRGATIRVAVAAHDVAAGAPLAASALRYVGLASGSPLGAQLLGPAAFGTARHWIALRPLRGGEPIGRGDVTAPAATGGLRAMAVAVPAEHAAGGSLAVGDRVDVIGV